MKRHYYTKEEDQFLKKNVNGISLKELTDKFNKKFSTNVNEDSIQNRKVRLKIKSGIFGGRFEKGSMPFNKGKKWNEYMSKGSQMKSAKTTFKKGTIPHNHKKVGSERINVDGYIEIKIKEPNKWELKHRYIYKKQKGDIPKGYKLIFADGNKTNLILDNLILVSSSEELIMNRRKLRYDTIELTKTGSLIAKVIDRGNKLKNERL